MSTTTSDARKSASLKRVIEWWLITITHWLHELFIGRRKRHAFVALESHKRDPTIGKRLSGFRVTHLLATGGMGAIYKAVGDDGREVVIKRLLSSDMERIWDVTQETQWTRFLREISVMQEFFHPHIVRFITAGFDEHGLYYVMEYVKYDLERLITRNILSHNDVLHIIRQCGAALIYVHEKKYLWRDCKPSNILVEQWGDGTWYAYITDFGIVDHLEGKLIDLTGENKWAGTLAFASPEQLAGKPIDEKSEQYSLALVTYVALVKHQPLSWIMRLNQPMPDPRKFDPTIEEHVALALMKALEIDPNDRFTSIQDFLDALGKPVK